MSRSNAGDAPLDWNDVRFFLAVARTGTLAKAALALGVDQTTVGRRIASLEERLRVALFTRGPRGFTVTGAGARVLAAAERMREAALDLWSEASEDDGAASGVVRIATTESLARAFVIPPVRALHERQPRIQIVLVAGWSRVDLRGGEADVAVRLVRPNDPRLACKKLGDFALRFYAARKYVERAGVPRRLADHPLVVYDESVRGGAPPVFADVTVDARQLAFRTNSGDALVEAARAGIGIAELPSYVGDGDAQLVRVLPEHEHRYSVWLVVPQARRRVAVVRAVCDAIAAAFSPRASAPPTRARARGDRSPRTSRRRP